jgi:hypothetical protein
MPARIGNSPWSNHRSAYDSEHRHFGNENTLSAVAAFARRFLVAIVAFQTNTIYGIPRNELMPERIKIELTTGSATSDVTAIQRAQLSSVWLPSAFGISRTIRLRGKKSRLLPEFVT